MNKIGLLLAQTGTAVKSATDAGKPDDPNSWLILAVIVAIFAVPILLGNLLARLLKLKDLGGRMAVVLLTFTLGVAPFGWAFYDGMQKGADWKTCLVGGTVDGGALSLVAEVVLEGITKVYGGNVTAVRSLARPP